MVAASEKLNEMTSVRDDVFYIMKAYEGVLPDYFIRDFFMDIFAMSYYWRKYSTGEINEDYVQEESFENIQGTGEIFSGMGNKEPHYFISDVHGDLSQLLFSMLEAGVIRFKEGGAPTVFYDVNTGESYNNLTEFRRVIAASVEEKEYLRNNLRILPNVELNPEFDGKFVINGDIIDRGLETEECLHLVDKLLREGKSQNTWGGKERLVYIIGNHEAWSMLGYEKNVNTFCSNDLNLNNKRKEIIKNTLISLLEEGFLKSCYLMPNGTIVSHSVIDDDIICNIYNIETENKRSKFLSRIEKEFSFKKREKFCNSLNEEIKSIDFLSYLAEDVKGLNKNFFFSEEYTYLNAPRFCQILGHRITESRVPEVLLDVLYKPKALMIDTGSNYMINLDKNRANFTRLILTSCTNGKPSFLMSSIDKQLCRNFVEFEVDALRGAVESEKFKQLQSSSPRSEEAGKVSGDNNVASESLSKEPGVFEQMVIGPKTTTDQPVPAIG